MLVIGVVILSHSIIPHDHHYNIVCDTSEADHHENAKNHIAHCHYFNEIISQRASVDDGYSAENVFVTTFCALIVNTDIEIASSQLLLFQDKDKLINFLYFNEIAPTRGSPQQNI